MKCIRCGHDSSYKDRSNQTCPLCKQRFAFEPRQGAKLTDQAFQNAIERVSGGGNVRWGAEHLYYELGRRFRPRLWLRTRNSQLAGAVVAAAGCFITYQIDLSFLLVYLLIVGGLATYQISRASVTTIGLTETEFRQMLTTWQRAHGTPKGLIERPTPSVERRPSRMLESDLADYSFDRAVICDRARTVDLLLANNFHFENNCAVLTMDGYPPGPFETVRTMLKRNPKLQVFALHDATVEGCTMAHRLTSDPSWFAGQVPVTDVGLRPGHAEPFRGLWLPAQVPHVPLDSGIKPAEAEWLRTYSLELAVVRPDQVLKRLFRAMNRQTESDGNGTGGGGDGGTGCDVEDEQRSFVIEDNESFSSDASADDGGADSFG